MHLSALANILNKRRDCIQTIWRLAGNKGICCTDEIKCDGTHILFQEKIPVGGIAIRAIIGILSVLFRAQKGLIAAVTNER